MDSMDRSISDAIQHSVKRLGYTTIRQHQQDILEKLLRGQDCLLVAPTGSGKSFIFEAADCNINIIQFPILKNSNHQYVSFLSNYLSNLQPCGLVDITVNKFKAMWFCL